MSVNVVRTVTRRDKGGEWRWTGYDSNGEPVADSNEGYVDRSYAEDAARSLFPDAKHDVETEDDGA